MCLVVLGCAGHARPATSFGGEECRGIGVGQSVVSSLDDNNGEQGGLYGECWKLTRMSFSAQMDVTIRVQAEGFAPEVSLVERAHLNRPNAGDMGDRDDTVTLEVTLKNNTSWWWRIPLAPPATIG
jgi:hypothetical protein